MIKWSKDELYKIAEADDLHISPFREDGVTYGTATWIWSVAVDDALYVRAYNGLKSRWYQAALRKKAGRIIAAGLTKEVQRKRSRLPSLRHLKLSVTLKSIRLSHFEPVDNKQLQALINRKPFRAFEIATTAGDHFPVLEEGDILNNRRRPELYFIFTEDGLAHWIEADDIVSVTTL